MLAELLQTRIHYRYRCCVAMRSRAETRCRCLPRARRSRSWIEPGSCYVYGMALTVAQAEQVARVIWKRASGVPDRAKRVKAFPRRGCASASSYGFWPFTEFPEVACPSSCATALATRDPGRNRSNTTLDRDQSRIGADVRAVRPHNLLPNCVDRCSFCAPCSSSCQQIRAARLRHPCCG